MWARRRTGTGRPLKGSTRVPVTEADAKESLWKLRRSWERGSARGARVRGPLNGPTPPSRERRSTHKTNSVGPTVADATERQEIGLAVRVQGFDPPGDVDTQLPYRGKCFFTRWATWGRGRRELKQGCPRPVDDLWPRRAVKRAETRYCTFVSLRSTGSCRAGRWRGDVATVPPPDARRGCWRPSLVPLSAHPN